jgi:hypothetical protein
LLQANALGQEQDASCVLFHQYLPAPKPKLIRQSDCLPSAMPKHLGCLHGGMPGAIEAAIG